MIGERVRELRERAGWSLAELGRRSGMSRQTLLAVEQGAMPRLDTAHALARALGVSLDALVAVPDEPLWAGAPTSFARWARVGDRLILHPCTDWAADVRTTPEGPVPLSGARDAESTLVLAGCDPALPDLAARFEAESQDVHVLTRNATSREALDWLQRGWVHASGLHLAHPRGYNRPYAEALGRPAVGYRLVTWEAGLAARTQKDLDRWPDLWQEGRVAVRPEGSEARALQDRMAARDKLPPTHLPLVEAASHVEAARAVAVGAADAAVMTRSAAALFGLTFRPWSVEPIDWVAPLPLDPRLERFFAFLSRAQVRRRLGVVPGYDASESGRLMWETAVP